MKTTKEKIAVMQAFEDGKKVEIKAGHWGEWQPCSIKGYPCWNWETYDYRLFSRIDEIPFSTDLKLVTYWSDGSCSVETL